MANESYLIKMEKQIRVKMFLIENKKITPKDSGIGSLMNKMKTLDEPLYDKLLSEYKKILKKINP